MHIKLLRVHYIEHRVPIFTIQPFFTAAVNNADFLNISDAPPTVAPTL